MDRQLDGVARADHVPGLLCAGVLAARERHKAARRAARDLEAHEGWHDLGAAPRVRDAAGADRALLPADREAKQADEGE